MITDLNETYSVAHVVDLVRSLIEAASDGYGLSSMTSSLYDTSWIACVSKEVRGQRQWLFPQSFALILKTQSTDGGWSASNKPDMGDDILTTLAALHSLILHDERPLQIRNNRNDGFSLRGRISLAAERAQQLLQSWRLDDVLGVGFEILLPAILDVLAKRGFHFDFPGRADLYQVRDRKLLKLNLAKLYDGEYSTVLHSLEAFYGTTEFDFSSVCKHITQGSLMASPAATSAFLMRCKDWNDEAEAYLRLVLSNSAEGLQGAAPCAYPSTNFETLWVSPLFKMLVICF